jgi:hypothetical protein
VLYKNARHIAFISPEDLDNSIEDTVKAIKDEIV